MDVVLDMDPGVDDAVALMLALNSEELNIVGITTTYGNVPVDIATKNVFRVLSLANRIDVPVYVGSYRPILSFAGYAEDIHGEDGLGGVSIPYVDISPKGSAVPFLMHAAREYEDLTIVSTGPLTNIALAILVDREFPRHVGRLIHMGGAYGLTDYGYGNVGPVNEFNIYSDPHAAKVVFESDLDIFSIGLDVTMNPSAMFNEHEVRSIGKKGGEFGRYIPHMVRRIIEKEGAVAFHDAVPVAYLVDNSLLKFRDLYVSIEVSGVEAYGAMIVDRRNWLPSELRQGSLVKVAYWIDGDKFKRILWDRVFMH